MKRACFTKQDLMFLAELVTASFGVPCRLIFWKNGTAEVLEAKRFFCLYLYAVEGMGYKKISKFLRLNHDGARMLLRRLAMRDPFPYTDIMHRVTTDFRKYLETKSDERQAESTVVCGADLRPTEVAQAHEEP
jgi:hypothetical protein